jgi:formate-dependent nitrite reductase membrane component NrfD
MLSEVRKDVVAGDRSTYYGMPALKAPVWRWFIPAYLYTGGLAGTSAWLGLTAQLTGDPRLRRTVVRCRTVATLGLAVSAAFLIGDLGRPGRFYNMLRVFRPTSPMNLGTWILSAAGATNGLTFLAGLFPKTRRLGDRLSLYGGTLGLPLTAYTSVLLANTAVPLWQQARRSLPALFLSSGLASAASLLELFPLTSRERRVVRAWAIAGKAAELAATAVFAAEAQHHPEVGRSLHEGLSGALFRGSRNLLVASLVLSIVGRRQRTRRVAGALGTLATMALRFAVTHAGAASTRDPRATFGPQRRCQEARELAEQARPRAMEAATDLTPLSEVPLPAP